jgi:hypothetical protein
VILVLLLWSAAAMSGSKVRAFKDLSLRYSKVLGTADRGFYQIDTLVFSASRRLSQASISN